VERRLTQRRWKVADRTRCKAANRPLGQAADPTPLKGVADGAGKVADGRRGRRPNRSGGKAADPGSMWGEDAANERALTKRKAADSGSG